jgi:hypothetical protein
MGGSIMILAIARSLSKPHPLDPLLLGGEGEEFSQSFPLSCEERGWGEVLKLEGEAGWVKKYPLL